MAAVLRKKTVEKERDTTTPSAEVQDFEITGIGSVFWKFKRIIFAGELLRENSSEAFGFDKVS